jgi:hypothetical protein
MGEGVVEKNGAYSERYAPIEVHQQSFDLDFNHRSRFGS